LTDEKTSSVQPEGGFNLKRFLEEVVAEMKKVTWSSKRELVSYTCVVAIAVVIVCSLIWVCDTIFARVFHVILR
jgi:preprotein translocase subunit SecE